MYIICVLYVYNITTHEVKKAPPIHMHFIHIRGVGHRLYVLRYTSCTHNDTYNTYQCFCFFFKGESPYYLKNLSSGQYELLVIGKRKESLGSLRFKFTIERDGLCDPVIYLSSMPAANGSVAVSFHGECFTLSAGGVEETMQFQCSTAGREFSPCEFVYVLKY